MTVALPSSERIFDAIRTLALQRGWKDLHDMLRNERPMFLLVLDELRADAKPAPAQVSGDDYMAPVRATARPGNWGPLVALFVAPGSPDNEPVTRWLDMYAPDFDTALVLLEGRDNAGEAGIRGDGPGDVPGAQLREIARRLRIPPLPPPVAEASVVQAPAPRLSAKSPVVADVPLHEKELYKYMDEEGVDADSASYPDVVRTHLHAVVAALKAGLKIPDSVLQDHDDDVLLEELGLDSSNSADRIRDDAVLDALKEFARTGVFAPPDLQTDRLNMPVQPGIMKAVKGGESTWIGPEGPRYQRSPNSTPIAIPQAQADQAFGRYASAPDLFELAKTIRMARDRRTLIYPDFAFNRAAWERGKAIKSGRAIEAVAAPVARGDERHARLVKPAASTIFQLGYMRLPSISDWPGFDTRSGGHLTVRLAGHPPVYLWFRGKEVLMDTDPDGGNNWATARQPCTAFHPDRVAGWAIRYYPRASLAERIAALTGVLGTMIGRGEAMLDIQAVADEARMFPGDGTHPAYHLFADVVDLIDGLLPTRAKRGRMSKARKAALDTTERAQVAAAIDRLTLKVESTPAPVPVAAPAVDDLNSVAQVDAAIGRLRNLRYTFNDAIRKGLYDDYVQAAGDIGRVAGQIMASSYVNGDKSSEAYETDRDVTSAMASAVPMVKQLRADVEQAEKEMSRFVASKSLRMDWSDNQMSTIASQMASNKERFARWIEEGGRYDYNLLGRIQVLIQNAINTRARAEQAADEVRRDELEALEQTRRGQAQGSYAALAKAPPAGFRLQGWEPKGTVTSYGYGSRPSTHDSASWKGEGGRLFKWYLSVTDRVLSISYDAANKSGDRTKDSKQTYPNFYAAVDAALSTMAELAAEEVARTATLRWAHFNSGRALPLAPVAPFDPKKYTHLFDRDGAVLWNTFGEGWLSPVSTSNRLREADDYGRRVVLKKDLDRAEPIAFRTGLGAVASAMGDLVPKRAINESDLSQRAPNDKPQAPDAMADLFGAFQQAELVPLVFALGKVDLLDFVADFAKRGPISNGLEHVNVGLWERGFPGYGYLPTAIMASDGHRAHVVGVGAPLPSSGAPFAVHAAVAQDPNRGAQVYASAWRKAVKLREGAPVQDFAVSLSEGVAALTTYAFPLIWHIIPEAFEGRLLSEDVLKAIAKTKIPKGLDAANGEELFFYEDGRVGFKFRTSDQRAADATLVHVGQIRGGPVSRLAVSARYAQQMARALLKFPGPYEIMIGDAPSGTKPILILQLMPGTRTIQQLHLIMPRRID